VVTPLRITVKYDDLTQERTLTQRKAMALIRNVKKTVRKVSLAAERRVKSEMPVDTGRARASWGHWTPGDADLGRYDNPASPNDAAWKEEDGGLSIEQGTNVEYVTYLNDGHSAQAPAGFIDRAEEIANQELDRLVEQDLIEFSRDE